MLTIHSHADCLWVLTYELIAFRMREIWASLFFSLHLLFVGIRATQQHVVKVKGQISVVDSYVELRDHLDLQHMCLLNEPSHGYM